MICKIVHGKGFKGVLLYALKESKHPEVIATTATCENPQDIAYEFHALAKRSKRTAKPVAHYALSLADNERLSDEGWARVIEAVVSELGADAYVGVRHQDTAHDHLHLIMSRVRLNGRAWDDSHERRRMRRVCMALEVELGLAQTHERAARKGRHLTKVSAHVYPTFNHNTPSWDIER